MIPLRSVPMLAASLGVVALVIWLAAFGGRNRGIFVDMGTPVVAAQQAPAGAALS